MANVAPISYEEYPLQFFESFLEEGFKKFYRAFYDLDDAVKDNYEIFYINKETGEKSFGFMEHDEYGNTTSDITTIFFNDALSELFNTEAKKALFQIRNKLLNHTRNHKQALFYTSSLSRMIELLKGKYAAHPKFSNNAFLIAELDNLSHSIAALVPQERKEIEYPDNEGQQQVYNDIFGCRLNMKQISDLHSGLLNIGFFDNEILNQKDAFISILTSHNSSAGTTLTVFCSKGKAAYIFRRMEQFFSKLSFTTIEESKVFVDRKGQPFKAQNLYKALNKYNQQIEIDPDIIADIDAGFETLPQS